MKRLVVGSTQYSLFFNTLSESDILDFQDIFLTPGFHSLTIGTVSEGRDLITTFLGILNCYSEIGCLTQYTSDLSSDIFNIYDELAFQGALANTNILENFFLEQFFYDFIWIEASHDLLKTHWYWYFEQRLRMLNPLIPIIIVSYSR